MTKALVALSSATVGGVYYTANINFADLTAQPTWTKLATTGLANTNIKRMQNDGYTPYDDIYLQLTDDNIYKYNGTSWDLVLSLATARTISGIANGNIGYIYADPTTAGSLYTAISATANNSCKVLKSTDYGANWSVIVVHTGLNIGEAVAAAIGNYIVCETGSIYTSLHFSSDGGASFTDYNAWSSSGGSSTRTPKINRHNPNQAYFPANATDSNLSLVTKSSDTVLQNGYDLYNASSAAFDDLHWIDPLVANHERILRGGSVAGKVMIYSTTDQWANFVDSTPSDLTVSQGIGHGALAAALENDTYQLFGLVSLVNAAAGSHFVWGIVGDNPTACYGIDGTNFNTSPYTDAIPSIDGAYVARSGIFVGEAPARTGVYVYADEQGDITAIPDYENLGDPMFGDRGSWRDLPADGFDKYHAEDVQRATPQIHAPWDDASPPAAGYGIVSDGAKWIVSTDEIALVGDIHDPVTLDADAAILLDLTGQEIGLDTQAANTVFAGPVAGAANEPTFRALVLDDLTAVTDIMHQHIINEDHSGDVDGAEVTFSTLLVFRKSSTAVYLNGLRQWLNTDYTEAATLDSITMTTAPETDDILIIDYIVEYSDFASIDALLLETDDYLLIETGDHLLLE